MLKDKLYISDNLFSHANSSSWYNSPKKFEWVRDINGDHIVLTDNNLINATNYNHKKKYAWLVESPHVTNNSYEFVKKNSHLFFKIFTFDKEILESTNNSILTPIGGCWILEEDRKIHKKNKNISIISSSKKHLEGHNLRHKIIKNIKDIDVFGNGYNPIDNKIDGLRNYKFSICVENCKKDYYFTEKIIDCFITGTIPIYWGCPSIGNFFDMGGIITFNDIDELKEKIISFSDNEYEKRMGSVLENFKRAQKYLVSDDLLYAEIKNNQ
jgi:hypothetical protein